MHKTRQTQPKRYINCAFVLWFNKFYGRGQFSFFRKSKWNLLRMDESYYAQVWFVCFYLFYPSCVCVWSYTSIDQIAPACKWLVLFIVFLSLPLSICLCHTVSRLKKRMSETEQVKGTIYTFRCIHLSNTEVSDICEQIYFANMFCGYK